MWIMVVMSTNRHKRNIKTIFLHVSFESKSLLRIKVYPIFRRFQPILALKIIYALFIISHKNNYISVTMNSTENILTSLECWSHCLILLFSKMFVIWLLQTKIMSICSAIVCANSSIILMD